MTQYDLSHLDPCVQSVALGSARERLVHLKKDLWLGYNRANKGLKQIGELLEYPKRQRMPNLLILGPTNNGKSMLVTKFIRSVKKTAETPQGSESVPIIHLQMPSDPKVVRFYHLLLNAVGAPHAPRAKVSDVEIFALKLLEKLDVKMLIIDEVHNLLAGTAAQQREMLNLLRFLGNSLCIPLVCIGTKEAYLAIRSDAQLENRFEPLILQKWQYDAEYLSLLASFASMLPLRKPSDIQNPRTAQYILAQSEGIIGEISRMLCRAAAYAIEQEQEMLSYEILRSVAYQSPSERIHTFERSSF